MSAPNWSFLAHIIPTGDEWAYSSPTETAWLKLQHFGQFPYPNRAVGLLADAEFTDAGEVLRLEARIIYHSVDSQLLYIPPPAILTKSQRRIAVRRLARTPSYTPWELSLYATNAMPMYNEAAASTKEEPITDSTPSSFSAPVFNIATPAANYRALVANLARRKFSVTNIGTIAVYCDLDAPTANDKRSYTIAPGTTFLLDFNYQGEVYLWSSKTSAQNCEIRELI